MIERDLAGDPTGQTAAGVGHQQSGRRAGSWQTLLQALRGENQEESSRPLGDFTTTPRVIFIALLAIAIGALGAVVALILLRLIGLFTNLFFYQRFDTSLISPASNRLGPFEVLVPVIGALIIGLMARYGSERIRGHGIPEAIEAILINGSRVQPRVAFLKPLSSAISIGSGGPFGAEGPIIMTGGAFGSMIAQLFHLSSAERKTLLVAGAAAGMSATFASPVAAVLLAVELLLFEWKPRSMIPVALASATAAVLRRYLIGMGPLFPTPPHPAFIGPQAILCCLVVGLLAGALSALLTVAVYASEDAFRRLPIHWMWWPAIGGLAIGLGGLIFPQALGVGYDTISALLQGTVPLTIILGVLLVKSAIWAISLGSGTSGGVLAPLLLMGGALGGLLTPLLPAEGPGFWPLVSMGAILGGTMRSPFTGIVFMLELTHDVNALLPLLIAVTIAHAFTVLVMRRSILTEKVSRRGYHLTREYSIDPLEIIFIREVMRTSIVALPASLPQKELLQSLRHTSSQHGQRLYPVIDEQARLVGVLTRRDLELLAHEGQAEQQDGHLLAQAIRRQPVICHPDEPLRLVVYRMAATGLTRLPVVERESRRLVGLVSISDLLQARVRTLIEEQRRERVLRIRLLFPFGTRLRALRLREEHLPPPNRESSEEEQTHR
ncbi:chloride channel protein [Thermogemmatispora aurantia]|uniref:Chloride channel protein n=2 Tax=Thermogemmatispora TaxID=768669 RepID=A0A5J4K5S6_9CHLR|nr:chloride channel protein [Thermogemmatispora aurantia]GER82081.1 chloride channel protein [Thermogemmatispora aurantia]